MLICEARDHLPFPVSHAEGRTANQNCAWAKTTKNIQKPHTEVFPNMLYVTISCPFFNRRRAISKPVKRIEAHSMFYSPAFSLPLECNKLRKDPRMTLHCPPGLSKAHRHTWHIWNPFITLQIPASPNREGKYMVGEFMFQLRGASQKSTDHRARLLLLKRCP